MVRIRPEPPVKALKQKATEKVSSAKIWLFQLYKCIIYKCIIYIIREKERRDTSAESDCTNRNVFIAIRRAV